MDMVKQLSESNNRDIIIQLDDSKSWTDHIIYFIGLRDKDLFYELIVKDKPKTTSGCRCYLSHKGSVAGWIEVYSIMYSGDDVVIKMFPYINKCETKMKSSSFLDTYRYFFDNSFEQ
jgi:hypothetical protein